MFACRPSDGQHVVQRHRDVCHHDLQCGMAECLATETPCHCSAASWRIRHQRLVSSLLTLWCRVELAPHLPADPEEKNATGEREPKYLQQLRCDAGECNPKSGCSKNSDYDRALALLGRQAGCGMANDNGIVSGQHQVDYDDLDQGHGSVAGDEIGHNGSLRAGPISQPIWSVMFDPIQSPGPEGSQGLHVVGEQRQADRQHPQASDRQKPKSAANGQQYSCWNSEPAGGGLPHEANG